MDVSAKDQRVLVTAGGAGIGRAIAKTFLEHGARVHVCDVDERALKQLKKQRRSPVPRLELLFL